MRIKYTGHAKEKIAEREIPAKLVEQAIAKPDIIINAKFGRKIAQKLVKGKILRIVYTADKKNYTVITAYCAKPERYGVKK